MIFDGAKFCSHCGAKIERQETETGAMQSCPHCRENLQAVTIGQANLRKCAKCEGLWVDKQTLLQICQDREKQSTVLLGMPAPLPAMGDGTFETVRYRPCPVCKDLMNRVNFANCSHVIVDVCGKHGTWFDKDELRKVIEFIRAGGMDQARSRQLASLESERSKLQMEQIASPGASMFSADQSNYRNYEFVFDLLGDVIKMFLK